MSDQDELAQRIRALEAERMRPVPKPQSSLTSLRNRAEDLLRRLETGRFDEESDD